jgi:tetratricopeptide (TPR) repeat protein
MQAPLSSLTARLRTAPLLVALGLLAPMGLARPVGLAPPTCAAQSGERESLEDFLERARAERALLHARLQGEVDQLVVELEGLDRLSRRRKAKGIVQSMVALGPNATPLLVEHIDPGTSATDKKSYRAGRVSDALEQMNVSPITAALIRVLQTGTEDGRSNAARVLASARDTTRVRPEVLAAFRASEGTLKATCLRTLISLGGAQNDDLLSEVLRGEDEGLIDMALDAFADLRAEQVAPQVRAILADDARAERHAPALVEYYAALPHLVGEEEIADFVAIAASNAPVEVRVAVIDALPAFQPGLNDVKRALKDILSSRDDELREAALACLARLGDRGSRKDLLESYNDVVERNPDWSEAYSRRAKVLYRIEDYTDAIRDYRDSIELGKGDPKQEPEPYIMLARCYAKRSKMKDAVDWLRKAPISLDERRALADDPDFRELRDSRWGKEAFALDD